MSTNILFIQDADENGYQEGKKLVDALEERFEIKYEMVFQKMPPVKDNPDYAAQWMELIDTAVKKLSSPIILIGHGLGASLLLKYYTENKITQAICGIFLIATPYWTGNEEKQKSLALREDFADSISEELPLFFHHAKDDQQVPVSDLDTYQQKLPQAVFRTHRSGGHGFMENIDWLALEVQFMALFDPETNQQRPDELLNFKSE